MDNLLKRQPVSLSRYAIHCQEECVVSGEFTLPEYCPDIAMVLKCILTPCVQNRQWSGEQLLVDSMVNVRVLYLDEERCAVHSVEFSLPASCGLRTEGRVDISPVEIHMKAKYANCRAISPRRLEVRGAVVVEACAETFCEKEMLLADKQEGLYTQCCTVETTYPAGMAEKILTVSESVEFPETLPPAEMLLGGECRAVVRECKLLSGKAIVKGQVYVHQLYTDDIQKGSTHCLDYVLPFSQILDLDGAEEGMLHWAGVQILSDTERCTVGPDGENTILDINVKLLVQLQVFSSSPIALLLDAYHTAFPVTLDTEELVLRRYIGDRRENAILPMQMNLPSGQLSEIIDVWIHTMECDTVCKNGIATINGRLSICILGRDLDGQIVYLEQPEDYRLEYACDGNRADVSMVITELRYRAVSDQVELQLGVCVELRISCVEAYRIIRDLKMNKEMPYARSRETALIYYASEGENVWDIGRRCHTSPECICEENDLASETLHQPTVLLVPILP